MERLLKRRVSAPVTVSDDNIEIGKVCNNLQK